MMYTVVITKSRDNPNFDAQLKDYKERSESRYGNPVQVPYPDARIEEKALSVTLTDEEFAAVKKACLGVM